MGFTTIVEINNDFLDELQKDPGDPAINPTMIYQVDGCSIYRFYDEGYCHYFVKCVDGNTSTLARIHYGKGQSRPEEITTTITDGYEAPHE